MRRLILPLAVLALAGCIDSTGPFPDRGRPDALEFSFGGFGGSAVTVELRGDTVDFTSRYWEFPHEREHITVVPTAAQWADFWRRVDEAGVMRWRREYLAEHIADGMGWGLRLSAAGRTVESQGSNAFPDFLGREHEGDATREWHVLADAVLGLVGKRYGR